MHRELYILSGEEAFKYKIVLPQICWNGTCFRNLISRQRFFHFYVTLHSTADLASVYGKPYQKLVARLNFFWGEDRVSLCSPGYILCSTDWPQLHSNPPASGSRVLGLQTWTTLTATPWILIWLHDERKTVTILKKSPATQRNLKCLPKSTSGTKIWTYSQR